jgi:hypothetical protein
MDRKSRVVAPHATLVGADLIICGQLSDPSNRVARTGERCTNRWNADRSQPYWPRWWGDSFMVDQSASGPLVGPQGGYVTGSQPLSQLPNEAAAAGF